MKEKLFDSEAKVMEIIWEKSPISAKEISLIAGETIGFNYASSAKYLIVLTIWLVYEFSLSYHETTCTW